MEKQIRTTVVINGQPVEINTTVKVSSQEIQQILERKEREFLQSFNASTPYQTYQDDPAEDQQFDGGDSEESSEDDCQESYTSYSSVKEPQSAYRPYVSQTTAQVDSVPKSYHPKINDQYAPYHTQRVIMDKDWKPK